MTECNLRKCFWKPLGIKSCKKTHWNSKHVVLCQLKYSGQAIGLQLNGLLHKLLSIHLQQRVHISGSVCVCVVALAWLHKHFEACCFRALHLLIPTLSCCQVNKNKEIIYLRGWAHGTKLWGSGSRHVDLSFCEKHSFVSCRSSANMLFILQEECYSLSLAQHISEEFCLRVEAAAWRHFIIMFIPRDPPQWNKPAGTQAGSGGGFGKYHHFLNPKNRDCRFFNMWVVKIFKKYFIFSICIPSGASVT